MARRLERCVPPWADGRKTLRQFGTVLLILLCHSLLFLPPFFNERASLIKHGWHYASTAELLDHYIPYLGMPPFWTMAWRYLTPFPLLAAWTLCADTLRNYLHCRKGARSDYTLRRLRDPWEYHRRCLTLPALGALVSLLAFALLTGLYYAIYLRFTPPEWLLPATQRFWG